MARMSIDDMFLRDPRVRDVADEFGWNKYEARGRLLDVYAIAYDRVDSGYEPLLTAREIDIASECTGLAAAMVKHRLASPTRNGLLYIKGSADRSKYLATRESSGRAGGIKSGESRRNKAKVEAKVTFANSEGPSNPSPDLSLSLDPSLDPTVDPDPKKKMSLGWESAYSADELAARDRVLERLGKRNEVKYEGSKKHTELIVARLREGRTEDDLRRVIAYCAEELGWQEKTHKCHAYLRPETLFGPETIERYVYKAREYRKSEPITQESAHG